MEQIHSWTNQDKQIWERHVAKWFGQGIWHHTQWILNNAEKKNISLTCQNCCAQTWISYDFVSVLFSWPSHENYLSRHPEISSHIHNLGLPNTSRSRKLHILPGLGQPKSSLKELGIFFQKNAESREIPTKIEMQKMGKMILRLPLRSKFKEKSTKTAGNWNLFFFSKFWKDEFHQGVFCANVSTIMQVHAQLSFGTRCA